MKAMVHAEYGSPDVLREKELLDPVPNDREVLIRTHATTVTSADWRVRSLTMPTGFGLIARLVFGIFGPRKPVLGTEIAGEIIAVGKDVTRFKAGDRVFAFSGTAMGCHAQYKCMPEDGATALMPAKLSDEEAAALPFGGSTALDFFRRAKLKSGDKVLVNGASGAVGSAAVQLARHFGAEVSAVCGTTNVEWVKKLGATHVIDYTNEDFTANGETYDVIVDTVGTAPFPRSKHSLKENGRLLLVLAGLPDMLWIPWVAMTSSKRIIAGPAAERAEDLRFLAKLAEAGEFKPVIDRQYPFEQIIDAHRYVGTGRKKGNVVITLSP
ncbi:MAG: NAD(P)-dependent alcohol dehydrogenase [Burkholderiales bacterium]